MTGIHPDPAAEAPASSAEETTLATLRSWAEDTITQIPPAESSPHATGYLTAARDVLTILDMHSRPPHEPAHLAHPADAP